MEKQLLISTIYIAVVVLFDLFIWTAVSVDNVCAKYWNVHTLGLGKLCWHSIENNVHGNNRAVFRNNASLERKYSSRSHPPQTLHAFMVSSSGSDGRMAGLQHVLLQ